MEKEGGFFKNHADTIAIIGVNIAIAAIIITMWLGNTSRIDSANCRVDNIHATVMDLQKDFNQKFYDLLREGKK